jgi:hemerythrin-like domain-containing protein
MFLQIAEQMSTNGMNTTWTTANVLTIGAVVAGFVGQWIKMLINKTKLESKIEVLETDLNRESNERKHSIDGVIAAKGTIKFELNAKIDAENQKIHDRITKTQEHQERVTKQVQMEFKEINNQLGDIKTDIGRVLGKLDNKN